MEELADKMEQEEVRARGGGDGGGGVGDNGGSGGEKEVKTGEEGEGEGEAKTQKKKSGNIARELLPSLKREFADGWSLGANFFCLVAVGSKKGDEEEEGKEA